MVAVKRADSWDMAAGSTAPVLNITYSSPSIEYMILDADGTTHFWKMDGSYDGNDIKCNEVKK